MCSKVVAPTPGSYLKAIPERILSESNRTESNRKEKNSVLTDNLTGEYRRIPESTKSSICLLSDRQTVCHLSKNTGSCVPCVPGGSAKVPQFKFSNHLQSSLTDTLASSYEMGT